MIDSCGTVHYQGKLIMVINGSMHQRYIRQKSITLAMQLPVRVTLDACSCVLPVTRKIYTRI